MDASHFEITAQAIRQRVALQGFAMRYPRWGERPLLAVVPAVGATLKKEDVLGYVSGKVASWQVPDDVIFVEALPMTATGKVSKLNQREQPKDYALPAAVTAA